MMIIEDYIINDKKYIVLRYWLVVLNLGLECFGGGLSGVEPEIEKLCLKILFRGNSAIR